LVSGNDAVPKQQTDVPQLNQFQEDTQRKLTALVEQKGREANFETVAYHYGSIDDSKTQEFGIKVTIGDYETWIHPDGADVCRGADKVFEIYDYASLDDLQSAYLKFVGELLG
jgi:hypothetical protein